MCSSCGPFACPKHAGWEGQPSPGSGTELAERSVVHDARNRFSKEVKQQCALRQFWSSTKIGTLGKRSAARWGSSGTRSSTARTAPPASSTSATSIRPRLPRPLPLRRGQPLPPRTGPGGQPRRRHHDLRRRRYPPHRQTHETRRQRLSLTGRLEFLASPGCHRALATITFGVRREI
jgi:hypothetical protein